VRIRLRRDTRGSAWAFLRDAPAILPYLARYKRLAVISVAMIGTGTVIGLLAPWPLAILLDTVLADDPRPLPSLLGPLLDGFDKTTLLVFAVVAGVLVVALEHGLNLLNEFVNTKLEQRMILDFRSDLFQHAQRLSLGFHDNARTGMLMYQINDQAHSLGAVTVSVPPLVQSLLTLVGMFAIAYKIDPQLALMSLTVVPFVYYSAGYYTRRIGPRLIEVNGMEARSLTIVHEAMQMLRVIVAFGRERHEYGRFRAQGEEAVDARVKLTVRQTMFSLGISVITAGGTALVLGFGAAHVLDKQLTVGELMIVMGYIAAMYQPLEGISATLAGLQQHFIGLRGALNLLDTHADVEDQADAVDLERARGDVTFEEVDFSYRGRIGTLKHVSFDAAAGQRIGIVGPTGAGKSTLVSLLVRFYDPGRGRVLVDGVDIRTVTLESLRAHMSLVLQEPLLFSATIRENIRYGRLEAEDDAVVEAARAANADGFITALPNGYETELGERGAQLSGGERQRIAVARAFLKDAPILILDEPTSSIDSKTEAVILEALERLTVGRTTFMIAHRLSTIRDADLILVLDDGEIVQRGTHDELVAAGGLYRHLYEAQVGDAAAWAAREALETRAAPTPPSFEVVLARLAMRAHERGNTAAEALVADLGRSRDGRALDELRADAAWLLVGAVWSVIEHGSTEPLEFLAAHRHDGAGEIGVVAELAHGLLLDLNAAGART
jgi:ATP-binding cassette subfamily B protein